MQSQVSRVIIVFRLTNMIFCNLKWINEILMDDFRINFSQMPNVMTKDNPVLIDSAKCHIEWSNTCIRV